MSAEIERMIAEGRLDYQFTLVREHWAAVRRLWLGDSDCLGAETIRSDLPKDFLLGCGMPGIASVQPTNDGRFEFAEDGLIAVILPVYDTVPGLVGARAERHVEELRDLVAVDIDHLDRYRRRHADALLLGNAYLEVAGETRAPVPVFKTPLSWLKDGGAGICILDWDYARDLLLGHELVAEDLDLGAALEDALKPDIWIGRAAA